MRKLRILTFVLAAALAGELILGSVRVQPAEWPLPDTQPYDLLQIWRIKEAILALNSSISEAEAQQYAKLIWTSSKETQLDHHLAIAVAKTESDFDSKAVSSTGARGVMQIMPATGRALGVQDLLDPAENIPAGMRYLKSLLVKYRGNVELALAAYNAGALRVQDSVPDIPETQNYVRRVMATYRGLTRDGPAK
ncbi:MAG: lytic transglycosylase domain-containing protein [Firmicutes bacterium]|nr:lytic transglycosylase domain-containing protein [Bacillota bacterium]